jgi:hypothetical protein
LLLFHTQTTIAFWLVVVVKIAGGDRDINSSGSSKIHFRNKKRSEKETRPSPLKGKGLTW